MRGMRPRVHQRGRDPGSVPCQCRAVSLPFLAHEEGRIGHRSSLKQAKRLRLLKGPNRGGVEFCFDTTVEGALNFNTKKARAKSPTGSVDRLLDSSTQGARACSSLLLVPTNFVFFFQRSCVCLRKCVNSVLYFDRVFVYRIVSVKTNVASWNHGRRDLPHQPPPAHCGRSASIGNPSH